MIHFLDFSNEKMVAKVPDIAPTADILLGNLEDAVPVDRKEAARDGPGQGRQGDRPRRHAAVDARQRARVAVGARRPHARSSTEIGDKLDVIMVPKVEGPWDIHYVDRLLAQLEAKAGIDEADPRPRDPRDRARASRTSRRSPPPRRACRA